ncbi:hypothetical protein L204_102787 [Cryptococcus depauperatus]|nr:hypothetical protein L204_00466 [Cryptococcus depauperatus CBS 7855]
MTRRAYFQHGHPVHSPALLPHSTLAFIASWQGQLLVCTLVLLLGAVYFFVRGPIEHYRQSRRERLAQEKEQELMAMETPVKEENPEEEKPALGAKDRGRERKKDMKRKKGVTKTSTASTDSSPSRPPPIVVPSLAHPCLTTADADLAALESRIVDTAPLAATPTMRYVSTSDLSPCPSPDPSEKKENGYVKAEGFSIFPDDSYLPIANSKKKKKGKGTGSAGLLRNGTPNGENKYPRESLLMGKGDLKNEDMSKNVMEENTIDEVRSPSSSHPRPSRNSHRHTSSISNQPNLSLPKLREIVEDRDDTIEALRAEVGVSKAEEAKALDQLKRARENEERLKGEVERWRKAVKDGGEKRRENDLQARYSSLQKAYTTALHRLTHVESLLRDLGHSLPPSSPLQTPLSPHPHSTHFSSHPQSPIANMASSSPYLPNSGRSLSGGYWSAWPGLSGIGVGSGNITTLLHPNLYHSNPHNGSPATYRRTSSNYVALSSPNINTDANGSVALAGSAPTSAGLGLGDEVSLAGPLTPGLGEFRLGIDSGIMPIGQPNFTTSLAPPGSGAERRRKSIERSVLKNKIPPIVTSSSNGIGKENESGIEKRIEDKQEEVNGCKHEHAIGHPAPNHTPAATVAVTSADIDPNGELPVLNTGVSSSTSSPSSSLPPSIPSIPSDPDPTNPPDTVSDGGHPSSSTLSPSFEDMVTSLSPSPKNRTQLPMEPIFASLAHTPEQVEEMKRMREMAAVAARGNEHVEIQDSSSEKGIALLEL